MKAKDLKKICVPLELGGRVFNAAFDFNAIAELEEVYGEFNKALRAIQLGRGRMKAIRAMVYAAIKPRSPKISILEVGTLLIEILNDEKKAEYVVDQILKAVNLAFPEAIKEDEGEKKPHPVKKK